jgi:hypothetical protein
MLQHKMKQPQQKRLFPQEHMRARQRHSITAPFPLHCLVPMLSGAERAWGRLG